MGDQSELAPAENGTSVSNTSDSKYTIIEVGRISQSISNKTRPLRRLAKIHDDSRPHRQVQSKQLMNYPEHLRKLINFS